MSPRIASLLPSATEIVCAVGAGDELIVISHACDFPERVRGLPTWEAWPAAVNGRVYVADGNAYFNRPGPRIVESLEILAACVHPKAFEDFCRKHAGAVVRLDQSVRPQPI